VRVRWYELPATRSDADRSEPVTVDARDQVSHGRPAAQASRSGRVDEGVTSDDRQQGCRSPYVIDAFAAALDDVLQGCLLAASAWFRQLDWNP
jgi:hypothetical protein